MQLYNQENASVRIILSSVHFGPMILGISSFVYTIWYSSQGHANAMITVGIRSCFYVVIKDLLLLPTYIKGNKMMGISFGIYIENKL